MKKLILLLTVFFTCLGVKAQEATTDYIYSSDGFVIKNGVITLDDDGQQITYESRGLYTNDGKVLVSAISSKFKNFYVIDGCETIASNAFQALTDLCIYIPSSVKNIAPDAIISRITYSGGGSATSSHSNRFYGIQNGVKEEGGSGAVNAPAADHNATEVARYNIQGGRLSEPTDGVNIVQMSDGTAQKVLVK